MFCSNCGNQLKESDNFCNNCGKSVNENNAICNTENTYTYFDISQFGSNKVEACKYVSRTYNVSLKEAKEIVDQEYKRQKPTQATRNTTFSNKSKKSKSRLQCSKCQSTNIEVMGNDRKSFSIGKALGGTILTGGIGSLAGFMGKKGKYEVFCKDCGYRWKTK